MTEATEYLGVLAVAVIGGPIVAIVVGCSFTEKRRRLFCRWGLLLGLATVGFFGVHYLLGVSPQNAKSVVGLTFVGGPVGVAALLLSVIGRVRRSTGR